MKIRGRNITKTRQANSSQEERPHGCVNTRALVAASHSHISLPSAPLAPCPPLLLPCPSNISWKQENTNKDDGVMASPVCLSVWAGPHQSTPSTAPRQTLGHSQRHSRHELEKVTSPGTTHTNRWVRPGHAIRSRNAATAPSPYRLFSGPADIRPAASAGRASGATLPISKSFLDCAFFGGAIRLSRMMSSSRCGTTPTRGEPRPRLFGSSCVQCWRLRHFVPSS